MRKLLAGAILIIASSVANSAIITVERGAIDTSFAQTDLAAHFATLVSTTTENIVDATGLYRGSAFNYNIFKLSFEVNLNAPSTLDLFAGLDAGFGAEVFVNGNLFLNTDADLWWGNRFTNAGTVSANGINLIGGLNTIDVYWAEKERSGGNSFGIQFFGSPIVALSVANLEEFETVSNAASNSISAPAFGLSAALMMIALVSRRKRK